MKKNFIQLVGLIFILFLHYSCERSPSTVGFEDMEKYTIYDYLVENKDNFSSFISILEKGGLDKTLSAYNPNGIDYTLFVPDNKAVENFVKTNGKYTSLDEILKDKAYVEALARYHVINMGASTLTFPFGTFSEPTLSGDYLNVNFIFGKDTTYYKINNQATVTKANLDLSNGYVHVIGSVLKPITQNSYGWLKNEPTYSIFTQALEATGYSKIINVDMKLVDQTLKPFTLLVEPNSVYQNKNIKTFNELANAISPGRTDYTNATNPLNLFVGYHILTESKFLDDLEGRSTNYNTFADVPMTINGIGLDIVINKGKEIFEKKVVGKDTVIVDFVGINYDASNVNTQSGAIHFINQILKPQIASRSIVNFEFWEEWTLDAYRRKGGSYLIENAKFLNYTKWSGAKLYYVKSLDDAERAWSKDYMLIDGDFIISYRLPKIIQGQYDMFIGADAFGSQNALVEVFVDGIKLGGLVDLTKGGNAGNPYLKIKIGSIDFKKYDSHTIELRSLIPGRLKWDYVRFEPI